MGTRYFRSISNLKKNRVYLRHKSHRSTPMRKLRAAHVLCFLAACVILIPRSSMAQIADPVSVRPEGGEGATHFGVVAKADPGGGVRSYRCWRFAGNQSSQIGCSDFALGSSPGNDILM